MAGRCFHFQLRVMRHSWHSFDPVSSIVGLMLGLGVVYPGPLAQSAFAQQPVPAPVQPVPAGPSAVPPSAPATDDPGMVPSVPIFGPHSGMPGNVAEVPPDVSPQAPAGGADRLPAPLPPGQQAPNGSGGGGLKESDIRAYAIPEMDLTPVQTEPGGVIWERNAVLAFHKAKTLQRPLLLLFTAQWNNICQKLSEEVFVSNTFNTFAKENCVICFVDYPQNSRDASESMLRVKEKFQVRGYPSLIIFDPDGNVVQQMTGYRPGRPVAYYNELFSIVDPLCIHLRERKKKLVSEGYRDWSDANGTQVFAQFVSHNTEKVMIAGPAGDRWIFPISTLAAEDQALVRSFPEYESEGAGAATERVGNGRTR